MGSFCDCKKRRNTKIYKNGLQIGINIVNTSNITNSSPLYFGVESGLSPDTWFGGYLTNIRIVKGLAVYTDACTTPTSALTAVASANPYGDQTHKLFLMDLPNCYLIQK